MLFEEMRARRPIILSADDYERLSALANAGKKGMPDPAADLVEEIGRAHVLAKGSHPERVVCMNSEVQFRDDTTQVGGDDIYFDRGSMLDANSSQVLDRRLDQALQETFPGKRSASDHHLLG
jgi:hypothetical protein